MLIKTKSIYEPKNENDGHRVLITRYYPRGVKKDHFDEWLRILAPSAELLKCYKTGEINWLQFTTEFLMQMHTNNESVDMVQTLADLAKRQTVTLLCYERNGNPCHRYLVHDLIAHELEKQTTHVRHIRFQGDINNNKMERFNGEFRDREKVVRGLKKKDSVMFDGYQIYHNYVRAHQSLDNKTPAEKCGIKVEGENKWVTLIQNATKTKPT